MVAARSEYGDDKNCEMKHEETRKEGWRVTEWTIIHKTFAL